ncbi:TY-Chap domain-containing protein [Tessaracoccus sp. G1721]
MTPTDSLATRIAVLLRRIRGTVGSITVETGPYFYQLASYDMAGQLLIETVSNEFLDEDAKLDPGAQDRLAKLGLSPPDDVSPNWSIRLERATDGQIEDVARAVATALIEVYGVAPFRVAAPLRHLREGRDSSFHLDVRLRDDGAIEFEAQDLGPVTALVSDDGEYEYWRVIDAEHVPDLLELLGAGPGDDVVDLLARDWSGPASFDLEALLRDAPFPVKLTTW